MQEIDPSVLDKDEIEAKELQPEGTAIVNPFSVALVPRWSGGVEIEVACFQ